ncbi:hypothetical protein ACFX5F_13730 [Flavobacterium sp. ZS1P70]|uniref:Bacteriocin n=1 Tax=Flavobacterium zhoui TaxID=3230414 RepID=A0ABW6I7M7_9FLAO
MNLENSNLEELSAQEIMNIDGGWYILRITGVLDGIEGNTHFSWFNFN